MNLSVIDGLEEGGDEYCGGEEVIGKLHCELTLATKGGMWRFVCGGRLLQLGRGLVGLKLN